MINQPVPSVDVHEAHRRLSNEASATGGPLLVDVREISEFIQVRAEGALLLPLSQFMARYRELPTDRPLLMICHSGGRSLQATTFLLANGWNDVTNVAGGTAAWEAFGLAVRTGPPSPDELERSLSA